jgi:hypothetical protein
MAHRLDGYAPYGDRIQVGVFDLPIYKPTVLGPAEPWIIEAINTVFDGIPLYRVVHICYEHEEGQPGYWISRQTAPSRGPLRSTATRSTSRWPAMTSRRSAEPQRSRGGSHRHREPAGGKPGEDRRVAPEDSRGGPGRVGMRVHRLCPRLHAPGRGEEEAPGTGTRHRDNPR